MDCKIFLSSLALTGVVAQSIAAASEKHPVRRDGKSPDIIFILADDLGYGDISCFNKDPKISTPNVDRLAKEGVMMTQAYASPVSSPTRTTYLTGKFPQRSGVYGNPDGACPGIGPLRPSFTEDLKAEGYNTAWFGKWHQGWDVSNHPLNNGFDVAYGFLGGMHDYIKPYEGSHYNGGPYSQQAFVFDGFSPVDTMSYFTREITDRAISYIAGQDGNNPFYVYLAYNAPHTPLQAPGEIIRKYLESGCEPLDAARYAMIEFMDREIGRLLDFLDKQGLADNTIVVFMSDNGAERESHNGGFRGTKMTMWEGGIRVPMVVRYPDVIPEGGKVASICSIVDLAATFIGVARNDPDFRYGDGINLMPFFQGAKQGNAHDALLFSLQPRGKVGKVMTSDRMNLLGIRMDDWKLVRDKSRGVDELYNLAEDPAERKDLSTKYPEIRRRMIKYADDFLKNCPESCNKSYASDTRERGDNRKRDSVLRVCEYLETLK